jgi:hypothetical protein
VTVYTLKKRGDTGELHLFEATESKTEPGKCTPAAICVCRKMKSSESTGNFFACKDEADARKECARAGREVCGPCVSHLYTTY